MRNINKEKVHAQAVTIGRIHGFPSEAGRPAASKVERTIDKLIERLNPKAWLLNDQELIEGLGRHLWLDWVTVEYRAALGSGLREH